MWNLLAQAAQGVEALKPVQKEGTTLWLPPQASTVAGGVDWLFDFILIVTVFFTVLILALMVYFVIKYRHREGRKPEPSPGHSTTLELTWTIIPTILVIIIFFYGFRGFLDLIVIPPNTYEIQTRSYMWGWAFTYPNGAVSSELHVPDNQPVRIVLSSDDVIHSFYIPAFRVQKNAVPGRYNKLWFQARLKDGATTEVYHLYCNQYCGRRHSEMVTNVIVEPREKFEAWVTKAADIFNTDGKPNPLPEVGKILYGRSGCSGCHSVDGSAISGGGPSWKNLFGKQGKFADGQSYVADEDYIRESIFYPARHIVAGYPNVMNSYLGQLKDREIDAIIAYMKSISENYKGGDLNATSAPATTGPSTATSTSAPTPPKP